MDCISRVLWPCIMWQVGHSLLQIWKFENFILPFFENMKPKQSILSCWFWCSIKWKLCEGIENQTNWKCTLPPCYFLYWQLCNKCVSHKIKQKIFTYCNRFCFIISDCFWVYCLYYWVEHFQQPPCSMTAIDKQERLPIVKTQLATFKVIKFLS